MLAQADLDREGALELQHQDMDQLVHTIAETIKSGHTSSNTHLIQYTNYDLERRSVSLPEPHSA
jgi:hypothetical protein